MYVITQTKSVFAFDAFAFMHKGCLVASTVAVKGVWGVCFLRRVEQRSERLTSRHGTSHLVSLRSGIVRAECDAVDEPGVYRAGLVGLNSKCALPINNTISTHP